MGRPISGPPTDLTDSLRAEERIKAAKFRINGMP
jgi:hypothetical protein